MACAHDHAHHLMNLSSPSHRRFRQALAASVIGTVLTAVLSPVYAAAATGSPDKPDEVVVLSPFVVSSETETGYQATSSLAGTRLNTNIKDIGAALSIYTKDFMQDIGASNAQDLLVYATGVEVAGANGN